MAKFKKADNKFNTETSDSLFPHDTYENKMLESKKMNEISEKDKPKPRPKPQEIREKDEPDKKSKLPLIVLLIILGTGLIIGGYFLLNGSSFLGGNSSSKTTEFIFDAPKPDGNKITVTVDTFVYWQSELTRNPLDYVGMEIEVTGEIFRDDEGFKDNEFGVGIDMADDGHGHSDPLGFMAKYDKAKDFKNGEKVIVTGILSAEKVKIEMFNHEYEEPIINVTNVEKI